ncbi:MptD family putative ECF transporter S component [Lacrimispora indolis]|uniref:MptD family putative ECF transporter S component n=1 Tax=Lacrimispora indolis TaxID=69825 RepID=UPI000407CA9F|nr:MptD family putative ECF transporter S component [[Clostridium] methoxybenzovorans]
MSRESSSKLSMKDIIIASVLGVICIAIRFLFMILGGILPVAWFASHMFDAIFIGPVYMLIVAKTRRTGPVFVISLVTGVIFISAAISIIVSEIIAGILAELALRKGQFENKFWIMISYVIFSFGFIGDFYLLWFHKESFLKYSENFMNAEYLDALSRLVSAPTMIFIIVSILIGSLAGGFLGFKLMRKHFVKAGVAQ